MKKILIANRSINHSGGQEVHTEILANGLVSKGYMVSILCLESEINDFRELNKKIEVHVFANVKVADQNLCPRIFSTRYRKLIDKHDILIMNNPLSMFALQCFISSRKNSWISVFHSKMFSSNKIKSLINSLLRKIFVKFLVRHSTHLIFLTTSDRQFFSKINKNVSQKKYSIIPNGIDFNVSSKKISKSMSKSNTTNVLFVGRMVESKGVGDLLEVAESLEQSNTDLQFHFVGSGKLASKAKVLTNCTYHGVKSKEDINNIYQMADVFILPSYSESFPMTIIEAMFAGLPIIATKVHGISEVVGTKNLLIAAGRPLEIKKALLFLLNNEEFRKEIGLYNKKFASKYYSSGKMIDRYIEVLERYR